jgi:hypothetical protein
VIVKLALLIAIAFSSQSTVAQADLWKSVPTGYSHIPGLQPANTSDSQRRSIAGPLKARMAESHGWCAADPSDEWLTNLRYNIIPVTAGPEVWLVEAGAGCARGGQGSNGALWLIRFDGGKPVLLASPEWDFGGYLYSIQDKTSHGYKDLVLGWHMSASEADLTYFRFDGRFYRLIATATRDFDESGVARITPDLH